MSVSVTVAGTVYTIPTVGDVSWGPQLTSWVQAISSVTLQSSGGSFTLTGDLNFGNSYGLFAKYYTSVSSNPAGSGVLRLANADGIGFRNSTNTADLLLQPDADGILKYNGIDLLNLSAVQSPTNKTYDSTSTMTGVKIASFTPDGTHTLTAPSVTDTLAAISTAQTLTNKTISAASNTISGITNSNLSGSAAISNANLAAMANNTVKGNVSGSLAAPSDVTATSSASATTLSLRDSNANIQYNNVNEAFSTTPTAAGTTTLTVASNPLQQFTGTTTQTVNLPAANTLVTGCQFYIFNRSTGTVTVRDGGGNTLQAMLGGTQACFTCANIGSAAGSWDLSYTYAGTLPVSFGGTGNTAQTPYALLAGGTGSTTPFQQVSGVGNSGQVLTSNGASTLPTWQSVQGGGAKNYLAAMTASTSGGTANIGNGNFELGSTAGWSLAHSALSSFIPTSTATAGSAFSSSSGGTSASGNLSLSVVSSSQLSGLYSGSLASSTASTAGDMLISNAFFIDKEDQAKVLTFKFYYSVNSGASNMSFAGTNANSYAVWIYDVTNAAWIMPAGVYGMTQSTGVGYATGTFQTTSSTTQYQIALININASSGSFGLYVDDVTVGPQTAPMGPAVSDWVAYTPTFTGFGTVTTSAFYSRRVGDSLQVAGNFTSGTTTATQAQITIGYNGVNGNVLINPAKCPTGVVGDAAVAQANTTYFSALVLNPSTSVNYVQLGTQTSTNPVTSPVNGSALPSSSIIQVYFTVPITGWSSNVNMSNDTDTRVVAMQVMQNTPTATISSTASLVKFTSGVLADTHGGFSTSTGLYTVPVTGYYRSTFSLGIAGTYSTNNNAVVYIAHNGSTTNTPGSAQIAGGAQGGLFPIVSATIYCLAGDTLAPYAASGATSPTVSSSPNANFFYVERLSGPAVVAATESVSAIYTDTSGGAITATQATYTYATKTKDTHNAYSAGTYTIPVSGTYMVSATLFSTSMTIGTSQTFNLAIKQNGTQRVQQNTVGTGGTQAFSVTVTGTLSCLAGDAITIAAANSTGSTTANTSAGLNQFSIFRVGN